MLKFLPLLSILLMYTVKDAYTLKWDDLRVTWNQDLNHPGAFVQLPRTSDDAEDHGFYLYDDGCGEGNENKKFLGYRYISDDPTVILLFDENGYIAGLQNCIPKSVSDNIHTKHFNLQSSKAYQLENIEDEDMYCSTVYFVQPNKICRGRTKKEFENEGTGTSLYFQTSDKPYCDYVKAPRDQCETLGKRWNKGGCVDYQGIHYYYELCQSSNCTDWFPFSVSYCPVTNEVASFEIINHGNLKYSNYYFHATKLNLDTIIPVPVPQCLYEDFYSGGGLSVLNVILTSIYPKIDCKVAEKI